MTASADFQADIATLIGCPKLACVGRYQEDSRALNDGRQRLMFTNPFTSGMKMTPEVALWGHFRW